MAEEWVNRLYFGDNLDILRDHIDDETVDLVYLDPPFNKKATYNILFKEKDGTDSPAQIRAFDDFWRWDMGSEATYRDLLQHGLQRVGSLVEALRSFLGTNDMLAYLTMMAVRLVELHRTMKRSATIYLHCDPTASHYLKALMDAVFGPRNFRNEVVWCYAGGGIPTKDFPRKHDVILRYTKTDDYFFSPVYRPYSPGTIQRGRTAVKGKYAQIGLRKEGTPVNDWWTDVPKITSPTDPEKLSYPTQKPEALLERIIRASSKVGDLVMDPFCGCGTTVAVAERLHRRWIGIDITHLAIALMRHRLEDSFRSELSAYKVIGDPRDVESARALAHQNRFQFQFWALGLVDARPLGGKKGRPDRGVDGVIRFFDDDSGQAKRIMVQVKSGHVEAGDVRDLKGAMEREKAQMGALITLEPPTGPMRREAAEAGFYDPPGLLPPVPRLQILTVAELLAGSALEYPAIQVQTHKKAPRRYKDKPKLL